MAMHFEELWEKCENLFKNNPELRVQDVIDELLMKINLYKALDTRTEIPEEERKTLQSRTMGEILLTLTHLSLKDNVNVYEALNMALQYRSIEHFSKKHQI